MGAVIPSLISYIAAYVGGTAVAAAIVNTAITIAVNYAVSALTAGGGSGPKPEDIQQTVKSATPNRIRHYGRVKTSGALVFLESKAGRLYKILYLGEGEFDAIEELWVDDQEVTLDGSDIVTGGTLDGSVLIQYRLGTDSQTAYADLLTRFTEYTTDHKGNGCAHLFAKHFSVSADQYLKTFPNGIATTYSVVARTSKIYNPVTEATAWNDNAAAVILDYMNHPDGFNIPAAAFETTQAAAGWITAYNKCNEDVDLDGGGTEKRYRLWGSYDLNAERRADVLSRMLSCCDATLVQTPDGGVTIEIGDGAEPNVVIDGSMITGWSDLSNGLEDGLVANTIKSKYIEPAHGYVTADADPWIDADDVSDRGEAVVDVSFLMAPSHTQCRRLMKLAYYRSNPRWVGQFSLNVKGLAVLGQRFVRITYPGFDLDEVFEVRNVNLILGDGGMLVGVTVDAFSMPAEAYEWDETTEEGTPPQSEAAVVSDTIPVPADLDVTIARITVSGLPVPVADVDWDAPSDTALTTEVRYKLTAGSDWQSITVLRDATLARSGVLSDGEEYEFQARHVSVAGRAGDWTSSVDVTPTADITAPGIPTSVSATGGVGVVDLDWTTPNSANFNRSKIYRHTANVFGSATLITTIYGTKNAAMEYSDSIAAGTYYYWITAENSSGVASSEVATGSVTAT